MTENEALKTLEDLQRILTNYRHISKELTEANGIAIECIEEIQAYRAVGTIEELQALKIENSELHCELQATYATLNLLLQEAREKAIDEFAEKLNTDVESFKAEVNGISADLLTLDYFSEFVFEVAEQMKGEKA